MATDFFERQDYARRQTTRLVVLFVASVVAIIATLYLTIVLVLGGAGQGLERLRPADFWHPEIFGAVAAGTGLVIGLGSLYKASQLASGGEPIALMLGGRAVNPQTTDLAERRLQNIVEEMSLASGVPVPPVYVLDHEPGINAFAAGHLPSNAVVAVSRGCLEYLTRDELQGVIGHEFSHILNGDMRLNLRLIAIVHGIVVLSMIGYFAMRAASSMSSSSRNKKGDPRAAIFLIGLLLYLFGSLGVLFGRIIKSAISRQREYLADAASVQFTRNPRGIAGALKKIGGLVESSRIRDSHAPEISHMAFGPVSTMSFLDLFATHPPLIERIRRLDPEFDGRFSSVEPAAASVDEPESLVSRMAVARALPGQPGVRLATAMESPLVQAAREPTSAQSLVFALLLADEEPTRTHQQTFIEQKSPDRSGETRSLGGLTSGTGREPRLSLIDLAVPSLKRMSAEQYVRFRKVVVGLTMIDGRVDLFEYAMRRMLFTYLDVHFGQARPPAVRYRSLRAVAGPVAVVLSRLAYAGHSQAQDAQSAFDAATASVGISLAIEPPERCELSTFDAALTELTRATRSVKEAAMTAAAASVAADGQTTFNEGALVRALRAALDCPAQA